MRQVYAVAIGMLMAGTAAADPADWSISKRLVGKWTTCLSGGSSTEADGSTRCC
ncbi:MAG TPA: hypothetical protein VH092_16045 [Urbifossiella sp.]|jgi:hypothetical protein|nr:hypothetical protein [Urbifossiella sp.]